MSEDMDPWDETETAEMMREREDEVMRDNERLGELCKWLLEPYRLGAFTGEGVSRAWCRETYDEGVRRARELGVVE